MRALETEYNGCRFRSRLEARWAVVFDRLGIRYEYEREGYDLGGDYYLPDFWLPCPKVTLPEAGYWVEIKPVEPTEREVSLMLRLVAATGHNGYIVWGSVGVGEFRARKYYLERATGEARPARGTEEGSFWPHLPANWIYECPNALGEVARAEAILAAIAAGRAARFGTHGDDAERTVYDP